MIALLVFTVICLYLINRYIAHHKFTTKLNIFPVFKGLPILGESLIFLDHDKAIPKTLEFFYKCGTSFLIYIGPKPYLVACDPELIELILSSNVLIQKNSEYRFLASWFGDGLLTSTGNKWKSHRKVLTPSFHYKILEEYVTVFDSASCILVDKLKSQLSQKSFDVYNFITLCTLDIICETAMGTRINAQDKPNQTFVSSIKDMCNIMYLRLFTLTLRFDWIYHFTKHYQTEKNAIHVMRNFSNNVIESRRKVLENKDGNQTNDEVDDFGVKRKFTFLDVLLQAEVNGRKLTDQEVREEVDTFMFEGHDTIGVALSFAVYLMSKHLDVQTKVYDEIISIVGTDKSKPVTMEDLHEMKYTEMVLKESLRLYPSVVTFGRHATEDVPYKNGVIPNGTEITINPYFVHRDPNIFPDPEKFNPERFTMENSSKRHPYAYIPFSAGPRNCIGQKFAMLEMKSTLAKILRYYEVLPADPQHDVIVVSKVTLQSSNGIRIRIKERM